MNIFFATLIVTSLALHWSSGQEVESHGSRVLEVSSLDGKLTAAVEFFSSENSVDIVAERTITARRYSWLDVPSTATTVRIKMGDLPSEMIQLGSSYTTISVGNPKISLDDKTKLPLAQIPYTVNRDRTPAPAGASGWVLFGEANAAEGDTSAEVSWRSLFLVTTSGEVLDPSGSDTVTPVLARAANAKLRLSFPLYIRQMKEGQLERGVGDPIVRPGQYVQVKKISPIDGDNAARYYAEIVVLPFPEP